MKDSSDRSKTAARDHRGKFVRANQAIDQDELFGKQKNTSEELGDPSQIIKLVAKGVVEVMAGMRDVNQLGQWLSDDVYLKLRDRATQAKVARAARAEPANLPHFEITQMRKQSPADGVFEAVVLLQGPTRLRAVTLRLEGYNQRWRTTSLAVL
ncbi:MAG: hypothetical protein KGL41_02980 [Actinomycetales bacterium]|nr:hypothetical protein [Actinomycetales bacterium]